MIKIISIGIISAILIFYLKSINSDLTFPTTIISGIIILISSIDYLSENISFINQLLNNTQIDNSLIKSVFKIIGVGYLVDFSSQTIEDFGIKSLSSKIVFSGKIIILSLSLPIFNAIYNIITSLL